MEAASETAAADARRQAALDEMETDAGRVFGAEMTGMTGHSSIGGATNRSTARDKTMRVSSNNDPLARRIDRHASRAENVDRGRAVGGYNRATSTGEGGLATDLRGLTA